jgi:large subunit ribosomal protein L24
MRGNGSRPGAGRPARLGVRKGDIVRVLSGKDRGRKGKILRVIPDEGKVVIEGVNVVKKHQRATAKVMQGGIIDQEAPLAASKVMLVCNKCNEPSRVTRKELPNGRRVRACKRCGEVLDK